MSLEQTSLDLTLDLDALQDYIRGDESPLVEFVELSRAADGSNTNLLTMNTRDTSVVRPDLRLVQVDSNLSSDQAGEMLQSLMGTGFQLASNDLTDVLVPGGVITIIAGRMYPVPPPDPTSPAVPNLPKTGPGGYIFTKATVFGLNMDGSPDPEDNGRGAPILGGINTQNPSLIGAAVPAPQLVKRFGRLAAARGQHVEVTSLDSGLMTTAQIVDFGPGLGPQRNGVALDLTLGAQRALQGNGKIRVKYRFV